MSEQNRSSNAASGALSRQTLVSLGDIVHNEAEVERLSRLGLRTVDERTDIAELLQSPAGAGEGAGAAAFDGLRPAVLIRAHGEPPATYQAARRAGITLVDATCPVVAALQRTVSQAFSEMSAVGGQVVIFGRRGHAEVRGLLGQAAATATSRGDCGLRSTVIPSEARPELVEEPRGGGAADVIVVESEADLGTIDFARPIYFLAQTTGSLEKFRALADEIRRRAADVSGAADTADGAADGGANGGADVCGADGTAATSHGDEGSRSTVNVIVKDTICRQVADREAAIGDFARRHDVVIFVCGEKSSNGRVLFDAVRRANQRSLKVQSVNELAAATSRGDCGLRAEWLADARSIGICGATSTPLWLMKQIAEKLQI